MDYYAVVKMNELQLNISTWMNIRYIMTRKKNQGAKDII